METNKPKYKVGDKILYYGTLYKITKQDDSNGTAFYFLEREDGIPNRLCSVSSIVDKNSELYEKESKPSKLYNIQEITKHIDKVMDKPVKVQDVLITKEGNSKTVDKQYESEDKMVSHPNHYQSSKGIEVIDVIEAFTEGLEGIEAVDTANAIKYICRWKDKNGVQDLEKTIWYVTHLINHLKNKQTI